MNLINKITERTRELIHNMGSVQSVILKDEYNRILTNNLARHIVKHIDKYSTFTVTNDDIKHIDLSRFFEGYTKVKLDIIDNNCCLTINTDNLVGWMEDYDLPIGLFNFVKEAEKQVNEVIEMIKDKPITRLEKYERNSKHLYRLLSRLQFDCKARLYEGRKFLWGETVETHINEMKFIYDYLEPKPLWITDEEIDFYKNEMK